jgi:ribonucleoside-diphosphate reductase alpha chain
MILAPQDVTAVVLAEKYCKGDEKTVTDVRRRVARALASVEGEHHRSAIERAFFDAMETGAVPAGRIDSAAGTDIQATLINCFVQPMADSVSQGDTMTPSIYGALQEAAETLRRGGGVGYDFSPLRPRGALVKGTYSRSSGPIPYMHVFNTSCATIESAGARRGAQMGALRIDHPDIEEFIHSKDKGELSYFNISVAVTDDFMERVRDDSFFELVHEAQPHPEYEHGTPYQRIDGKWVYRTVKARDLWAQIMKSTYDHAEPGILFVDRVNAENNLWYAEKISVTNPCAEQPLPPYGCCCLGSQNLTQFVVGAFTSHASFDWQAFGHNVMTMTRMLDNVLDVTYWPLPAQKVEAMNKRRIGQGFLGLGDALIMMGLRYDSEKGRAFAAQVSRTMRDAAYRASIHLAREKGAFPLFDAEKYLKSDFALRLPDDIRTDIEKFGIRNSHLLSIAPTGTITLAFADNASNGIEPAFSWEYKRRKRNHDISPGAPQWLEYTVQDHAYRVYRAQHGDAPLTEAFVTALEMSAQDHMLMMKAVQPYIDTSISKTVNVPVDYSFTAFENLYAEAWMAGLKGLATYRPNDTLGAVLSVDGSDATPGGMQVERREEVRKADPLPVDPYVTHIERRPLGDLQGVTTKVEYTTHEGTKSVYLTVNFAHVNGTLHDGTVFDVERPIEFFLPSGQPGEGQQWIAAVMRLLSLVARSGGNVAKALANMREVVWDKGPVRCGTVTRSDGALAPRYHDSEAAAIGYALQQLLVRRGYLTDDGRLAFNTTTLPRLQAVVEAASPEPKIPLRGGGKKCPECGAMELHHVDGCEMCANCGYIGTCG